MTRAGDRLPAGTDRRPAFYALAAGGWRDYVTLLHPPYTLWHLSYVALGAALAPEYETSRLLWTLLAFLLALGVGAHALDELNGRPLATRIGAPTLVALTVASVGGAVGIGVAAAVAWTLWLLPFVAFGAFVVAAYNLELFGGRFLGPSIRDFSARFPPQRRLELWRSAGIDDVRERHLSLGGGAITWGRARTTARAERPRMEDALRRRRM